MTFLFLYIALSFLKSCFHRSQHQQACSHSYQPMELTFSLLVSFRCMPSFKSMQRLFFLWQHVIKPRRSSQIPSSWELKWWVGMWGLCGECGNVGKVGTYPHTNCGPEDNGPPQGLPAVRSPTWLARALQAKPFCVSQQTVTEVAGALVKGFQENANPCKRKYFQGCISQAWSRSQTYYNVKSRRTLKAILALM